MRISQWIELLGQTKDQHGDLTVVFPITYGDDELTERAYTNVLTNGGEVLETKLLCIAPIDTRLH